jgi:4-amino-4-deoxy-L-arabinose transferase-like glycosyltransferase
MQTDLERRGLQERREPSGSRWVLWWIVAGFLAVQVYVIWFNANGPFVDEGLYIVAGLRVLEGNGLSDGYITWFNGSPFVWPVIAALGHRLGGLPGARFMAAILSTVTLIAVARTAENLFGRSLAKWCALAFAVNGLFMALAHFAVYDVAALTGLAVSMWWVTRSSTTAASMWLVGAAIAFACAVISKYGSMLMIVPLLGKAGTSSLGLPSARAERARANSRPTRIPALKDASEACGKAAEIVRVPRTVDV